MKWSQDAQMHLLLLSLSTIPFFGVVAETDFQVLSFVADYTTAALLWSPPNIHSLLLHFLGFAPLPPISTTHTAYHHNAPYVLLILPVPVIVASPSVPLSMYVDNTLVSPNSKVAIRPAPRVPHLPPPHTDCGWRTAPLRTISDTRRLRRTVRNCSGPQTVCDRAPNNNIGLGRDETSATRHRTSIGLVNFAQIVTISWINVGDKILEKLCDCLKLNWRWNSEGKVP